MYPVNIAGDGLANATLRLFGVKMRRWWVGDERYAGAEIPDAAELRRQLRELLGRGPIPEVRRREVLAALTSNRRLRGDRRAAGGPARPRAGRALLMSRRSRAAFQP